jgi:hypothetical protein
MKNSLRWRVLIVAAVLAALLFCPYKSTTAPAWRIQIVEENGQPVPNLQVKQAWGFFPLDIALWEDDRVTDGQGRTAFPRRTTWASLARRVSLVDATDGATAGPGFFIQACDGSHLKEAKLFWDGNRYWNPAVHEGESRVVAKPVKECGEID